VLTWSNAATQINVTGVQVEGGPVATPFENRPISAEYAFCQRYYQTGSMSYWSSTYTGGPYSLASSQALLVSMRATPSITSTFSSTTNASGATITATNISNVKMTATSAGSGAFALEASYTANAEL
jgi:hypothetical protein